MNLVTFDVDRAVTPRSKVDEMRARRVSALRCGTGLVHLAK